MYNINIKKIIFAFVIMLLCVNSFAAVINDNDSSAFVTKNEFDILKKDISNQISIYNKSINERIDGAINVYLSELNIDKKEELNNEYKNLNGRAKWMNLAWGSIFDGQANAYDSVKTYREPNFNLGDYLTGFAQYYYTAGENTEKICDKNTDYVTLNIGEINLRIDQ